jgi:cytoskeletal protein CcmA (bactofilin family)
MFGGKKDKVGATAAGTTLLASSVQIMGDVKFDGHLEVEGKVVGDILAEEGGNARVRILEKGVVEGEVRAPNVVINGHVTGDVHASKHLELAAHAVVNGNVHYQVIEMVKGAQVNGNLMHVDDVSGQGKAKKRLDPPQQSGKAESEAKPQARPEPKQENKSETKPVS